MSKGGYPKLCMNLSSLYLGSLSLFLLVFIYYYCYVCIVITIIIIIIVHLGHAGFAVSAVLSSRRVPVQIQVAK